MHRLRRESNVPHHRNTGMHELRDVLRRLLVAALQLDSLCPGFLHHAAGVAQRFLGRDLEGQERHVHHQQPALHAAPDRTRVVDHLVERHGERGVVAEHDLGEGVADEHDVGAGLVDQPRKEDVVCSERDDLLAALLHFEELADGDLPLARGPVGAHRSQPAWGRRRP